MNIRNGLQLHADDIKRQSMAKWFQNNPERAEQLSKQVGPLYFDYSKNLITDETLALLTAYAESQKLEQSIEKLFAGDIVNPTEQRPALHWALRSPDCELEISGASINEQCKESLEQMSQVVSALHNKTHLGYDGQAITDVVNIGIGGSHLGPELISSALPTLPDAPKCHFIANIDGQELVDLKNKLNPATTLFIVVSKSFTTQETQLNANWAYDWLKQAAKDKPLDKHFIAVTANPIAAKESFFKPHRIVEFGSWVGGRYSLWSSAGLISAIAIGMESFKELLSGANVMDVHFKTTQLTENMPVILALIDWWYETYFDAQSHAVVPYHQSLIGLPRYLQQLIMESNGKSVGLQSKEIIGHTAPTIFGDVGSNSQHSFHQLLHQGTRFIPVDFIIAAKSNHPYIQHDNWLKAHCLAQSQALMLGQNDSSIPSYKQLPGNRPSITIVANTMSPEALGALIAFYEHRVYASSILYGIDAFDQWGVELGKHTAKKIISALKSEEDFTQMDSSTQKLIKKLYA